MLAVMMANKEATRVVPALQTVSFMLVDAANYFI